MNVPIPPDKNPVYSPRKHGLKWMLYGGLAFVAAILTNQWLLSQGVRLGIGGVFGFAACGAFFLMGLLEVITNRSFVYWAQKWNNLKGWQRGILGTLIAISALIIFVAGIGWYFTDPMH
jgi:hypothetical protein